MKNRNPLIYLDNNATTELAEEAGAVVLEMIINNVYGNPSSIHEAGKKIKTLIETSRKNIAASLNCSPAEIIFTSGGTESNNIAIRGVYSPYDNCSNNVVMSIAEHPSVYNTVKDVAGKENIRLMPLMPNGNIDISWARKLITNDTALVTVMLANNETGAIFPVKKIARIAHKYGSLVHCDAVQAYGKIPIDVKELGIDILSISGHKVGSLPGIGVLYVRKGVMLHPTMTGGSQESGIRPGTENYIGIVSLGVVANEIAKDEKQVSSSFRDLFEKGLLKRLSGVVINAAQTSRVPNTTNITFKNIHAASLVEVLNQKGICASVGSACSSGQIKPSRTLSSMGLSEKDALSTIRISFGSYSTMEDLPVALETVVQTVKAMRQQVTNLEQGS